MRMRTAWQELGRLGAGRVEAVYSSLQGRWWHRTMWHGVGTGSREARQRRTCLAWPKAVAPA